jgi:hypothetical protein
MVKERILSFDSEKKASWKIFGFKTRRKIYTNERLSFLNFVSELVEFYKY